MITPPELSIRIPATSANLGPGFDIFGLALNQYTRFHFTYTEKREYPIFDSASALLPIPEEKNLVRSAFLRALKERSLEPPGLSTRVEMDLPTGRGFGSSASALVAGVAAANHLLYHTAGSPLSLQEELDLLIEMEGHPDNVCAARIGGWVFTYTTHKGESINIKKSLPESLGLAILIPEFQVSTKKSRTSLPEAYGIQDIKSNLQGIALWMEYLHSGDPQYLKEALLSERVHEPYRGLNIPGYEELRRELPSIGSYGATISGSGPAVLIYYPLQEKDRIEPQLEALVREVGSRHNQNYPIRFCRPDYEGLHLKKARWVPGHP